MTADASEKRAATPGHRVVHGLGGVKRAATLTGRSVKSVYRWLQPVAHGGGGGLIPLPAQRRMVAAAKDQGLHLEYADFAPRDGEAVL